MIAGKRTDIVRTIFMTLWGLATLVLFFMVVLLVNEVIKAGQDPMDALRPASTPETAPRRVETPMGKREVRLYFAAENGAALVPEAQVIDYSDVTLENCRRALRALIAGSRDGATPILRPAVTLRAMYLLDDGELVIDFSREILAEHARYRSATLEALMAYGVVNTLTQSALRGADGATVDRVRFLFEGAPPQEAFPAHIDLGEPIVPDQRWIMGAADARGNG